MALNLISLDWDKISIEECKRRVEIIKKYLAVKSIEVRLSPTNGFHIYVKLFFKTSELNSFILRNKWKDDGKRLMMDVFWRAENNKDNSNIIFSQKRLHGIIWDEVPLFLNKRKNHYSEWNTKILRRKVSNV